MAHLSDGGEGLGYLLRWEALVCGFIMTVPAALAVVVISLAENTRHRVLVSHLWVPCWRGLHPAWLLACRAIVLAVMCSLLFLVARHEGVYAFYFYTQWTFALVTLYFAIGTLVSAQNCWSYSREVPSSKEERNRFLKGRDLEESTSNTIPACNSGVRACDDDTGERANVLGYLMQIVYQTSAGAVLLTDVVFWCLIVPFLTDDRFKVNVLIFLMHFMNFFTLLLDTALNGMPFPLFRMAYFVLWSFAYITFQWILHACCASWWPYAFLELDTPWAPLWYFGIALIHVPCYCFYTLVVKLKESLFSKFFCDEYSKVC